MPPQHLLSAQWSNSNRCNPRFPQAFFARILKSANDNSQKSNSQIRKQDHCLSINLQLCPGLGHLACLCRIDVFLSCGLQANRKCSSGRKYTATPSAATQDFHVWDITLALNWHSIHWCFAIHRLTAMHCLTENATENTTQLFSIKKVKNAKQTNQSIVGMLYKHTHDLHTNHTPASQLG